MGKNNFFKRYVKYFIIITSITLIGLIQLYMIGIWDSSQIDNHYYEKNKHLLNNIQLYVDKHKLQGSIQLGIDKNISQYFNRGELYNNCILNNQCNIDGTNLVDSLKQLNIEGIVAYKKYIGILPIGQKDIDINGISFYLNKNIKLYGCKDNYIYYSKDYYKGKKEFISADGNKYHIIIKIFNNDWGIISYGCD